MKSALLIGFVVLQFGLPSPNCGFVYGDEPAFLPTWKLLSPAEKRTYVAGYLHGWRDAARVTRIVRDHVRAHPDQALESLEKVEAIYDLPPISPEVLVGDVDEFFGEPENQTAVLSRALSYSVQKHR